MTDTTDLMRVAAEIADGRHDGNLSTVFNAIRLRFAEQVGLRWRIDVPGLCTIDEDAVSLAAMAEVEDMVDKPWSVINPEASARECMAILLAWLVHHQGLSEDDAYGHARRLTVAELVECITWHEVASDPKGGSGPKLPGPRWSKTAQQRRRSGSGPTGPA